ncbi:AraC family transcriptional regulator [Streptomyces minutiscleroticus]|uniref:AraC family transcriptional regulator n=1 Tax=Streptomyces minutiscleroticus TaxID=68238 RepID=A0A918P390_9ACTN|nr:helix-turn-helix domain-containing protein [Streptomyces minutiscleroticus]GGY16276.1 AraC family transcriptional regulator [Streptomyces minutiscleroticus]
MIEAALQGDALTAADRFDHWREHMARTSCPMNIRPMGGGEAADFAAAELRRCQLGGISVWQAALPGAHLRRAAKEIQRSDPGVCHLVFSPHGGNHITHMGRTSVFGPYDMFVGDSSRPVDFYVANDRQPTRMMGLDVPKTLLPLAQDKIQQLLARPLPGRQGIGVLLADFLTRLLSDTVSPQPSDGPRLEIVLVNLLTALLAHHIDADGLLSAGERHQTLVPRIKTFIQQRLHDPHLTPPVVAAAHNISVSYLHRLFQGEEISISAWIRHQRLERARRDLADPSLDAWPVHRIAARWGFTGYPHFSRSFLAEYGMPPSDYRRQGRAADTR